MEKNYVYAVYCRSGFYKTIKFITSPSWASHGYKIFKNQWAGFVIEKIKKC